MFGNSSLSDVCVDVMFNLKSELGSTKNITKVHFFLVGKLENDCTLLTADMQCKASLFV